MELCYFMPTTAQEEAITLGVGYKEHQELLSCASVCMILDTLDELVQASPTIDSKPE